MYGLVLARHQRFPDIKTKGIASVPTLVILTSEESHYSIQKTAHWLGYGTDNVIKVKTDKNGKIIPHDLEMQIVECSRAGKIPIAVNATVGTTVLGAIDPLDDVADICKKYGIWMHVDACFGGSLIFSETHRIRLKGIERSDSIAWNAHKMLGAPLQCAIFITRHENLLQECNTTSANYLFQPDKYYDNAYDTGNKSIQCGRKVDAFKLWVMWKARGDEGFKERVDHLMDCARYFKESIDGREGFRLVLQQFESSNVCFYYIPKSMRGLEEDKEWWDRLYLVAPRMKKLMVFDGAAMIGYSPLKTMGNFWRINFGCEPQPSYKEMDTIIGLFEKYGQDLD
ncbi:PREDICTED: glutamate decarboxylase 1 [Nicrophorus vespilloides]|uniref:Glutamate decarboxylase 1 n=1 Tax=Nicrophorus vespilloides TaxID=110193 RepID=A0ABM1M3K7_NICVS|nr:PREDICTED: glutamate decarboxylase 1 [Nicrophorus vespilloides]